MKYCRNCGAPCADASRYCTKCGAALPAGGSGPAQGGGGQAKGASGRPGRSPGGARSTGLVAGLAIALAVLAAVVVFLVVMLTRSGKEAGEPSPSPTRSGPVRESQDAEPSATPSEKPRARALKDGIVEGRGVYLRDDGLAMWVSGVNFGTAQTDNEGNLGSFTYIADCDFDMLAIAQVDGEVFLSMSEGVCKVGVGEMLAGTPTMTLINDTSGIDYFSIYDGFFYYDYGYTVNRFSLEGRGESELADNVSDFVLTNRGIYYTGRDGGLYLLSHDGLSEEEVCSTPEESYLAAGEHCIYFWSDYMDGIGCYDCDTGERTELSVPGWTSLYSSIRAVWETSQGLVLEGEGDKVYQFDTATRQSRELDGFVKKSGGYTCGLPRKSEGICVEDVFYYTTGECVCWNSAEGAAGLYVTEGLEDSGGGTPESQAPESQAPESQAPDDSSGLASYEDNYFTLTMPGYWADMAGVRTDESDGGRFVGFYHLDSDSAGMGGHLFTIGMYPDGYDPDLPAYEHIGRLVVKAAEAYEVYAIYPTDVQFSSETESGYRLLEDDVSGVIATFQAADGYTLQK